MQPVINLRTGRYWSAERHHQHTQSNVCRNFQTDAKRAPNYYAQPFYFTTSPYLMQGSGVAPDPIVMCTYRRFPLDSPVVNRDYHSLSYRQRGWRRKSTFGLPVKPDADNEFWSSLLRRILRKFKSPPRLNSRLSYWSHQVISFNLRRRLRTPVFPHLYPRDNLDLLQPATHPPTSRLIVWHPKLPWPILIDASIQCYPAHKGVPGGVVSLANVISGLHSHLRMHVAPHEYFNAGLSERDRDQICLSFHERCCGDVDEMKGGVRRVDFLIREVVFIGFAPTKTRDTKVPVYELKTSVPQRSWVQ